MQTNKICSSYAKPQHIHFYERGMSKPNPARENITTEPEWQKKGPCQEHTTLEHRGSSPTNFNSFPHSSKPFIDFQIEFIIFLLVGLIFHLSGNSFRITQLLLLTLIWKGAPPHTQNTTQTYFLAWRLWVWFDAKMASG